MGLAAKQLVIKIYNFINFTTELVLNDVHYK